MSFKLNIITNLNKELQSTVNQLEEVDKQVVNISQDLRKAVGGFNQFSVPNDLEASVNTAAEQIKKLEKAIDNERKTVVKLQEQLIKLSKRRTNTTKKGIQQRVAEQALRKELRTQARAATDLGNSYDNLSAKNNQLIRERQNLAIRQKTNNDLTVEETNRLEDLTLQIQENQRILRTTDQEIGNFRRNVGNYASAYDGLGNSINQITRELPAFTNSVQTGFLAISNNLPILADEIGRLNRVNADLIAQGKPVQSVFKQIGSAIFSWQTLLSVGITLLTVYGKEIVEYVSNLLKSEKQLESTATSQENLNKAQEEGAKSASDQITTIEALFDATRDLTLSYEDRLKAADKIIELSGGLISKQERLNLLEEDSISIQNRLIKSISNRAVASALLSQNDERNAKIAENLIKIDERRAKIIELTNREEAIRARLDKSSQESFRKTRKLVEQLRQTTIDLRTVELEENDLIDENSKLRNENSEVIQKAKEISDEFLQTILDNNDANSDSIKALKGSIAFIEQQISKLEEQRSKLALNSDQWNRYTDLIDNATKALSLLQFQLSGVDLQPVGNQLQSSTQRIREALDDIYKSLGFENPLKEATDNAKKELDQQIEDFENAEKEKARILKEALDLQNNIRQEFTQSAIDSINSIFQAQSQRYENDIEQNSIYYDTLLENEALSDEQREALENNREEKNKRLREKQKEAEKKAFLFNQGLALAEIGMNLAKTIVAINLAAASIDAVSLGTGGSIYKAINIPIAIGTAAAQTAAVLAKQAPQFAYGGTMDHDGLMVINDHPSGRQEIVKRGNQLLMTPEKNALVYGKKGDEIIPDAKAYFNDLSDDDLSFDLGRHIYNANLAQQTMVFDRLMQQQTTSNQQLINELREVGNIIEKKQTRFNLVQDMRPAAKELGKQIRFNQRKADTL